MGTLLYFVEAQGLQSPYSCRSGICQSGVTKVLRGAVQYTEPMTPAAEGQTLICCSYPVTEPSDDEELALLVAVVLMLHSVEE